MNIVAGLIPTGLGVTTAAVLAVTSRRSLTAPQPARARRPRFLDDDNAREAAPTIDDATHAMATVITSDTRPHGVFTILARLKTLRMPQLHLPRRRTPEPTIVEQLCEETAYDLTGEPEPYDPVALHGQDHDTRHFAQRETDNVVESDSGGIIFMAPATPPIPRVPAITPTRPVASDLPRADEAALDAARTDVADDSGGGIFLHLNAEAPVSEPTRTIATVDATGAFTLAPPEETSLDLAAVAASVNEADSRFAEERAAIAAMRNQQVREAVAGAPWWLRLDPEMSSDDITGRKRLASTLRRIGAEWSYKLTLTGYKQDDDAGVRARLLGALYGHRHLIDAASLDAFVRSAATRSPIEAAAALELGYGPTEQA